MKMFLRSLNIRVMLLIPAVIVLVISCQTASRDIVVTPVEIDSNLVNPGRGFTSTGRTFNDNFGNRIHPLCGIMQQRVYWDQLEPEDGKINFTLIDSNIARCVKNGQQLNFRVMCQDEDMRVPEWALKAGVKSPFYDNPVFIEKQINLINALGKYYDGNPNICFVDIGTVGQWGEWHIDPDAKDPKKIQYPTEETVKKIIDAYFAAFKKTPLVSLIAFKTKYGFEYGTSKGSGWRADCWGDMDSLGWNHMKGVYPQALDGAKAHESWKNGPVALETCWTMNEWFKRGWDLDYILSKALEWHSSGVNNGSESIPAEWYPKVVEFEKKLGYRFVLETLTYPSAVQKAASLTMPAKWRNKGVAPVYNSYYIAVQLISKDDPAQKSVVVSDGDMKQIFPGAKELKPVFTLPQDLGPGNYELQLGIVNAGSKQPAIKLAIARRTVDGWYPMGDITITD